MKLHELRPNPGAKKKKTRIGRGIAAGGGKTAGRGTKGQGARSGSSKGLYFEGGQLPLARRLPFKRGFNNIFRLEYQEVNLDALAERFESGAIVTPESLAERGLIRDAGRPVVILGRGELDKRLTIRAHRFSGPAEEKIKAAGGEVETLKLALTGALATVKKLRKEQLAALKSRQQAE